LSYGSYEARRNPFGRSSRLAAFHLHVAFSTVVTSSYVASGSTVRSAPVELARVWRACRDTAVRRVRFRFRFDYRYSLKVDATSRLALAQLNVPGQFTIPLVPSVTDDEVDSVLKCTSQWKAAGPDELPNGFLRACGAQLTKALG